MGGWWERKVGKWGERLGREEGHAGEGNGGGERDGNSSGEERKSVEGLERNGADLGGGDLKASCLLRKALRCQLAALGGAVGNRQTNPG